MYDVELHIMPKEDLKRKHKITQDQVSIAVESLFLRKLLSLIAQRLKINKTADGKAFFFFFDWSFVQLLPNFRCLQISALAFLSANLTR